MEEIDQLRHYLRLDNLRAMLVLSEIERVGLNFEIDSSQTTPERKAEATARRDAVMIEWGAEDNGAARAGELPWRVT